MIRMMMIYFQVRFTLTTDEKTEKNTTEEYKDRS